MRVQRWSGKYRGILAIRRQGYLQTGLGHTGANDGGIRNPVRVFPEYNACEERPMALQESNITAVRDKHHDRAVVFEPAKQRCRN